MSGCLGTYSHFNNGVSISSHCSNNRRYVTMSNDPGPMAIVPNGLDLANVSCLCQRSTKFYASQ